MPTSKEPQGQSGEATNLKELGFRATFAINLRIFVNRWGRDTRYRYFHFDLNAGSGYNQIAGCEGSPISFAQGAAREGCERFHASFVDLNKECVERLLAKPEMHDKRCFVHHGNNAVFAECIPSIIAHYGERPHYAIGTVLCDPNGTEIPLAGLEWLSAQCQKLDFIINFNATATKRSIGAGYGHVSLLESLSRLGKKHWLIREPIGRHQWTMLVGRNYRVNDYAALGFYHLDSDQGMDHLARAHLTKVTYAEAQAQRKAPPSPQRPLF